MFGNNLPAVSTIRKWYSSINGKPGLSTEAFNTLKCKASEANQNGEEILVALVFDEMAIRKQEQHIDTKTGFVNFGTNYVDSDEQKYAKEALVFLVTGINAKFKIPVAYFLIDGVKAGEKAALLKEVMLFVGKTGVKIIALVHDGLITNIATAKALGANFKKDKLYFNNTHSDDIIFILPDACHSLKS